jgi:hypothetical protein
MSGYPTPVKPPGAPPIGPQPPNPIPATEPKVPVTPKK